MLDDFPDARRIIASSVNACGAPIVVDALRFGGIISNRTIFHGETNAGNVSSFAPLDFESTSAWDFSGGVLQSSINATQAHNRLSFPRVLGQEWFAILLLASACQIILDVSVDQDVVGISLDNGGFVFD